MDEMLDKCNPIGIAVLLLFSYTCLSIAYEEHLISTGQLERQTQTSASEGPGSFVYSGDWTGGTQ